MEPGVIPTKGSVHWERGNGCNRLSAFPSTSFIKGPDVVFVDAAVVFTQFNQNHLREEIFALSQGNGSDLYRQIR